MHPFTRKPWIRGTLAYGVVVLAWVLFAEFVAPAIVADAYHGRSLPALNRVLAERASRRPLEYYLDLWRHAEGAVLLGIVTHGALVGWMRTRRGIIGRIRVFLIGFAAAFLAVTVLVGPRQDYVAYLEMWSVVRGGGDPWWIVPDSGIVLNAYGPLFNVLAPLAGANPMAPKVLFAGAYLLAVVELTALYLADPRRRPWATAALLAWLANPSAWVQVAWYGHFDVLVAIACVAAVHLRLRDRDGASGACLGLGFLLKFLPAVLVPFLMLDGRRLRWRLGLAAGIVMVGGLALAAAVWGDSVARPFQFASSRGSNLLSVFRFLRGTHSPLRWFLESPDLDRFALPALAAALAVALWVCWRGRADAATSAVLAVLTTLLLYRVGFVQYQMVLYLLVPYWCLRRPDLLEQSVWLRASLAGYLGAIVGFDLFDLSVGGIVGVGRSWAFLEEWVGLPAFLLGASLWLALVLAVRQGRA